MKGKKEPEPSEFLTRFPYYLKYLAFCLLAIGLIMSLIGLYFSLIRAGAAQPDAGLDQQIAYLVDMRVGGLLFWYGLIIISAGIVGFLLSRVAAARET